MLFLMMLLEEDFGKLMCVCVGRLILSEGVLILVRGRLLLWILRALDLAKRIKGLG